jgi:hypothetical protein
VAAGDERAAHELGQDAAGGEDVDVHEGLRG